jgi:hypothetical protein
MSTRDNGGPAFPMNDMQRAHDVAMAACIHIPAGPQREAAYIAARARAIEGMSLRDYFAAKAMQGMMARDSFDPGQSTPEQRCALAYIEADAMLKARAA